MTGVDGRDDVGGREFQRRTLGSGDRRAVDNNTRRLIVRELDASVETVTVAQRAERDELATDIMARLQQSHATTVSHGCLIHGSVSPQTVDSVGRRLPCPCHFIYLFKTFEYI